MYTSCMYLVHPFHSFLLNKFLTSWQYMFEDYKKWQNNLKIPHRLPKCSAALDFWAASYWIVMWGWNGISQVFLFNPKLRDVTSQKTVCNLRTLRRSVFWDVMSYSLQITTLHGTTSRMTIIFIFAAVNTSDLTPFTLSLWISFM